MATLLAGPGRWESRFVRRARHDMRYVTFNAVMLAAHGKGARFRCVPLRDAAGRQACDMGLAENETELAPLIERNC
ncbi:hypothetical protein [Altererythrobacter sp. GH1-8]|uniref:hypothetical protein n=1 Tax=Altererythrobacter sp. GH1-8 TaxID=3349333 RepID=UPI00374D206D